VNHAVAVGEAQPTGGLEDVAGGFFGVEGTLVLDQLAERPAGARRGPPGERGPPGPPQGARAAP